MRAQKQAMLDAARPHLLRVLGPNCLGLLTPHLGLNASFAHTDALAGDIAFISQSGALVTAVLDWAKSRRIGFSHMVSLGEHADVDFGDLLDHLASEARTRSILLYVESIEAARKFMSAARSAARNKPVVIVKAGRAGHGVQAAASHTGALTGSDIVFDAAIRRAGMLRVDTLQDLFMAAETLARFGKAHDGALTMMTNGGGAGVMAADAAALADVPLRDLGDDLTTRLDAVLPPTWSRANPIDIIGDAPVERYVATLQALLGEPDGGAVLFMHAPTAIVRSDDIARACAPLVRSAAGRVMACWLGDAAVADARRILADAGAADYATPEEAVRAFALLSTYRRNQALLLEAPTASESAAPDVAAARRLVDAALAAGRTMLDEFEAKALLRAYAIPIVETRTSAPDAGAAADTADAIGYPVALKILSPEISHKTEVGGVALGLVDGNAVRHAAERMLAGVRTLRPQARITGFTVQRFVERPFAEELIVGSSIDPVFGPVLLFGAGGTAVEVRADRAIALPPLNRVLARDLIGRTRIAKLLAGYRDHPPAAIDAISDTLIALSQMLADIPELAELDINPLLADADGVIALDARVRLARDGRRRRRRVRDPALPGRADRGARLAWRGGRGAADPAGGRGAAQGLRRAPAARGPAAALLQRAARAAAQRARAPDADRLRARDGVHRGADAARRRRADARRGARGGRPGQHRGRVRDHRALRSEGRRARPSAAREDDRVPAQPRHAAAERVRAARERTRCASSPPRTDSRSIAARSDSDALCYTLDLTTAEPVAEASCRPARHDSRLTRIKVRGASTFYSRSDGGADGAPPMSGDAINETRPLAYGSCRCRCTGVRRCAVRCDGAGGPGPCRARCVGRLRLRHRSQPAPSVTAHRLAATAPLPAGR